MTVSAAPRDDENHIRVAVAETLPAALPDWLEARRWFADKGRGIAGVQIEDALVEAIDGDWLALTIARVAFENGEDARYLLPLAWTAVAADADIIAAAVGTKSGVFIDATEVSWFGRWLLDALTSRETRTGGNWSFTAHRAVDIASARNSSATLMRAEQSNTSLRFGEALIVKLYRRLQPGPNPDQEMLRALAGVGFERVPPYAGAASWHADDGKGYPIALAQAFVPNLGDGWSWMQRRLEEVAIGSLEPELDGSSPECLLGRRTGELHVALSQVEDSAFWPEAASDAMIAADVRRTRNAVDRAVTVLREGEARLPDSLRTILPTAIEELRKIASRVEGFHDETLTRRIRVHGDFHLGQTLRTPDGDWTLIDFEGEPARPVDERRQKTSALKDVAGMVRSFAYARGVVERAIGEEDGQIGRERLSTWESAARRVFLEGYRDAVRAAHVPVAPTEDAAFRNALAAWELDKALYEIAYEARNRPGWIELPLRSLLPDLPDQPTAATGAALA